MSQNNVTYCIDLTPENAGKIDAINKILLGAATSTPIENAKKSADTATDQAGSTAKSSSASASASSSKLTMNDLKSAAKKAKTDHGEDFVKAAIEAAGVKCLASLGRTMSKIPEDKYEAMITTWQAGPEADDLDDLGGDDLDDDLGGDDLDETPTVEAVKLALKAMSQGGDRAGAKALMKANGAEKLSDVDNCTPAQLLTMFKVLV